MKDVLRGCRKQVWIRATILLVWAGAAVVLPTTTAFTTTAIPISATTKLLAEKGDGGGGAPQYQKYAGILQKSECVGKGSYLLTIDYKNANDDAADTAADAAATDDDFVNYPIYEAGNVLALEIQPPSTISLSSSSSAGTDAAADDEEEAATSMPEKTQRDLAMNEGWLRGPYTVSYGYGSTSNNQNKPGFKVLIKDVGYKSHVMATARPGTPVRFGGQFKVPIVRGILAASAAIVSEEEEDTATVNDMNANEENLQRRDATTRVLMIASGVGVGPCLGATEQFWLAPERAATAVASMEVIASSRTQEDRVTMEMIQASDVMRQQPSLNVSWKNVITSDREVGRLSSQGPDFLRDNYLRSSSSASRVAVVASPVRNTHYHIIGNGQLVNEWKAGLAQAGVPSERVTVEAYFNHAVPSDPSAVETICAAILGLEEEITKKEKIAQDDIAAAEVEEVVTM